MLGVLLESKAARQRRDGGAAMSVATHLAIIGLAAAFTATPPEPPASKEPVQVVRIAPPVAPRSTPPPSHGPIARSFGHTVAQAPRLPVVVDVPTTLPPIDLGAPSESPTAFSAGTDLRSLGRPGAVEGGGTESIGGRDWSGAETMMRLLATPKPRYPERLRNAGISGRVRIRFVVDTAGRVELSSVQVIESTHDAFTSAVRDILPSLRFKPSEANGQRVKSLAEMPFDFVITR
jgi:protein TonB